MSESFPRDVEAEAASAIVAAGEFEAEGSAEDDDPGSDLGVEADVDLAETHVAVVPAAAMEAVKAPAEIPVQAEPPASTPAPSPSPSSATAPTEQQVVRSIVRAEALAELGRRREALDVLNGLIVEGAEDVRIWRTLAQIHLDLGDGDKALRAADWVVTFQWDDEWGYRLRSSALKLLQRPEEAVAAAERAVELAPGIWQGQATLALALHSTGDLTAAAGAARKASALAAQTAPAIAPEARQVADVFEAGADAEASGKGRNEAADAATAMRPEGGRGQNEAADEATTTRSEGERGRNEAADAATQPSSSTPDGAAARRPAPAAASDAKIGSPADAELIERLETAAAGRPSGLEDESLARIGNLVLRSLEFSAGAGWLVSFGGIAIPSFDFRFLIPVAVLAVLTAFLYGPARKSGKDIWRYLIEYMWRDPKTRSALIMAVAAHVWMIAGSSVGHVQGGSALTIGLLTHLAGRSVLAKKAPELNPVKRSGKGGAAAGETVAEVLAADVTSAIA